MTINGQIPDFVNQFDCEKCIHVMGMDHNCHWRNVFIGYVLSHAYNNCTVCAAHGAWKYDYGWQMLENTICEQINGCHQSWMLCENHISCGN